MSNQIILVYGQATMIIYTKSVPFNKMIIYTIFTKYLSKKSMLKSNAMFRTNRKNSKASLYPMG